MTDKYLLLSEIFPPRVGGSGRWFRDLYSRLDAGQAVVVSDRADGEPEVDEVSGIRVYRLPLASDSWGVISLEGLGFYVRVIRAVWRVMKQHDVSSIHCARTLPEGIVGMALGRITGKPYLCYVHGEDIEMSWSSREFTFLTRKVIEHSACLICNSENSAELLRKWPSAREERISILYPGVDAGYFRPDERSAEDALLPGKVVVLTVSRLQPRKGHDVMLKAMPAILARHPDLHYVIAGSGQCEDDLSDLVDRLGLCDNVSFLGECSDQEVLDWYRRSDLFVLPNRQVGNDVEGFGIVLLEAQSCETAVIAGDSGGTRETLREAHSGYVVDCRQPENLAAAITALLDDPEQLAEMGRNGRRWILDRFDWPRVIESAKEIFARAK